MSSCHTTLNNGIQLITEWMPSVETVSLGVWLNHGSRDEAAPENGMFHFIEHTLFKGTPSRTARDIAEAVDGIGGSLDAYTSREETSYSLKVRHKHLRPTLEILADMLNHPLFQQKELDREREVILEEIKMEEDNPDDLAYENSVINYWPDHPMGRPILGRAEQVTSFDSEQVRHFFQRHYQPNNLTVAAAGKVDHHELCQWLEELFPRRVDAELQAPLQRTQPKSCPHQIYLRKPNLEQVSFYIHFEGVAYNDPSCEAVNLLSTLLGGSMSSRLFQKVREDRGLAYSVGSFSTPGSDCGLLSFYGGCRPEKFDEVIGLFLEELKRVTQERVPERELRRAAEHQNGSLAMSLESTYGKASAHAREMMFLGKVFDLPSSMAAVDAVSTDQVLEAAQAILRDDCLGLYALGDLPASGPKRRWSLA